MAKITNIIVAGLGGQGVITASDLLAEAAFQSGYDVKKSEIHGMSQRGGSVTSEVRYGDVVFSPMVPEGEADYLVVLDLSQKDFHLHMLRPEGRLITPEVFFNEEEGISDVDDLDADESIPVTKRTLNTALMGVLSKHLDLSVDLWQYAIKKHLPARMQESNLEAFWFGRNFGGH